MAPFNKKSIFIIRIFLCIALLSNASEVLALTKLKNADISKADSIINYLDQNINVPGTIDNFLEKAQEALHISERNFYSEGTINALRLIAAFYSQIEVNTTLAHENIDYAIAYAKKINNNKLLAKSYRTKSSIYYYQSMYDVALENAFKAADSFLESNDTIGYVKTLINIGAIYNDNKFESQSINYFDSAIDYARLINNNLLLSSAAINASSASSNLNMHTKSTSYLKLSLHHTDKNNKINQYIIHVLLSSSFNRNNQYDSALHYGFKALSIADSITQLKYIASGNLAVAHAFRNLNNYPQAIKHFKQAYETSLQLGYKLYSQTSAYYLSDIYKSQKKYKESLKYFDIYTQHKDSTEAINDPVAFISITDKHEFEKAMKSVEKEYQQKTKLTLLLVIIVSIVLIAVVLGYFIQKARSKKNKELQVELKEELNKKNDDILLKNNNLEKKQHLISLIEENLKALKNDIDPALASELISEIKLSKSDNMWTEFDSRFGSLNDGFIKNIKKIAPDLTPFELKLCTFIRLNLSTFDISEITNQNRKTINTSRFRVRKKLGLTGSTEKLSDFLQDL